MFFKNLPNLKADKNNAFLKKLVETLTSWEKYVEDKLSEKISFDKSYFSVGRPIKVTETPTLTMLQFKIPKKGVPIFITNTQTLDTIVRSLTWYYDSSDDTTVILCNVLNYDENLSVFNITYLQA